MSRDHIEGTANAGQAMLCSSSKLGGIWMGYWNEQLAENAGAVRSLAACRSWDEAFSVQNEFARASLERLWARVARSAEITAGLISSSLRTLQ